jgi:methionyl-tRNA formyltransferase
MHFMTRIAFMGSPDFAVPVLKVLTAKDADRLHPYEVVGVVTQPDRPSGRGREVKPPAVKTLALDLGLAIIQPEKLRAPEAMEQLRLWRPDLIVVAAFGQILRAEVLALPTHGCINVHASLLPRWRGAAPVQAAISAGDEETGVTIMKMDEGVDTGAILAQRTIPIEAEDTGESLTGKLARLGAELLSETLPRYLSGELRLEAQDDDKATYAHMLKKEDGRLDFTRPADELARRVRALNPWPGAFMEWNGEMLKVHRAHDNGTEKAPAGQRLVDEGQAAVSTGSGLLILDNVQPAGKKPMSGKAFLAGARGWAT